MPADDIKHPSALATPSRRAGFTLAELLVVIGIVILLVSILVPVVGQVRLSGQTADTAALIRSIDQACETYHLDHKAWPGILPAAINNGGTLTPIIGPGTTAQYRAAGGTIEDIVIESSQAGFANDGDTLENVTGTENLVLSLLGGLRFNNAGELVYDPAAVGRGPMKLGGRTPGGFNPYFDAAGDNLSMHETGSADTSLAGATATGLQSGRFVEETSVANDSPIPEFVDGYSDPMPILYIPAQPAARTAPMVGYGPGPLFDLNWIAGYVAPGTSGAPYIGIGRDALSGDHESNGVYHGLLLDADLPATGGTIDQKELPYSAEAYFQSPSSAGPRQGDRFMLISAGPDRVYGTADDVTNFGSVIP